MKVSELFSRGVRKVAGACDRTVPREQKSRTQIRGYLDLIDLTDDQRAKVEQIRVTFLPRVAGIRQELRKRRMELADALFSAPPERERIRGIVEQISGLQTTLEMEVVEHILEEKGLLTPEQQRQFHAVIIEQFATGGLGVHDGRESR